MGVLMGFALSIQHFFSIFRLANKSLIFDLLDLKSKKECENLHHEHFKPIDHNFAKLIKKDLLVESKIMSSAYI
jgi:hypothetical protein